MGVLITLLLRVSDLIQAQGRVARRALFEFAVALALIVTAGALAALTCAVAASALFVSLWSVMPPAAALVIVASMLGFLTLVTALIARRCATPRSRR